MKYINDEKTVITLPVPLGTELYQVTTTCGDFCTWQEAWFDKVFPPTSDGRCGCDKPCHTVNWNIYTLKLAFHNMGYVLDNFGKSIFATKEEAEKRANEIVETNRQIMKTLLFKMDERGYGRVKEDADETVV